MKTRLTELLGIRYPILQGGLAYLARAELAAAVANAGGLGQVTATSLPSPAALAAEIARTRTLTSQPFAVNLALSQHRDVLALLATALDCGVTVLTLTGGNPEPVLRRVAGTGVRTLVLVSSVRQAQKAEALGADAVIAVGQEGGGHLGRDDTGTLVLVPRVVDAVSIPVVASGGIADGRGLLAALALGADGIEMGTRFVATQESPAHPHYKQRLISGHETDTLVIKRTLGQPGRVLRTDWAEAILAREQQGADAAELWPLLTGERNVRAALAGEMEEGFVWAGQSLGLIDDLPTVAELMEQMVAEAHRGWQALQAVWG
ncbi:MAG: nitronate monooxygenase family protein [Alicyclobacillus sp.]|nr:nitronate monooxygenase family protein [Alicyclobacillus sp.]